MSGHATRVGKGNGQQTGSPGSQLTVIVNTFHRRDLLRKAIQQYSKCDVVSRIHVNWAESAEPPDSSADMCCPKPLTFATPSVTHGDSSLNTRFLPVPDLDTDAVLNIDDDIAVSCATLRRTLRVWRQHPDQLVGWFPRLATGLRSQRPLYRSKLTSLLLRGRYNIVLTKGAIMHRRYLDAYTQAMPEKTRAMVAQLRNCEDLAMQFVVSNATRAAPVFVWDPWLRDAGAGSLPVVPGISTSSGSGKHFATRSACIAALQAHFGGVRNLPQRGVWYRPLQRLSPFLDAVSTLVSSGLGGSDGCRCAMRRSQH